MTNQPKCAACGQPITDHVFPYTSVITFRIYPECASCLDARCEPVAAIAPLRSLNNVKELEPYVLKSVNGFYHAEYVPLPDLIEIRQKRRLERMMEEEHAEHVQEMTDISTKLSLLTSETSRRVYPATAFVRETIADLAEDIHTGQYVVDHDKPDDVEDEGLERIMKSIIDTTPTWRRDPPPSWLAPQPPTLWQRICNLFGRRQPAGGMSAW